jgi:MFS family permease
MDAVGAGELSGQQLRRSLWLITAAWVYGAVWLNATAGAPLTAYASALGATEFQFGVLSALPFLASFLSLPGTLFIEATAQRKRIFLIFLYFQRLMWIPLALLPLWLVHRNGGEATPLAALLFLALVFLMHTGQAIGSPAWVGWMADIVPARARGRYFSRRRAWGLLSAIPAAWGAGWLLDRFGGVGATPMQTLTWCTVVFLVAAVFGVIDIAHFHWVPEVKTPPKRGRELLASWGEPLRNRNYLHFAGFIGMLLFGVSFMGQFVTLYVMRQLGAESGARAGGLNQITQLMLLVAPALAQLLVLGAWGRAADRMGKKPVLALAALGLVPVAIGWCFVIRDTIWLGYVLAAAGAALWTGVDVVNLNIVLEFSGSGGAGGNKGGTAYVAVNSVIINLAGCLGGFAAGYVAHHLRDLDATVPLIGRFTFFHVLFLLSALLRLLAVVLFLPRLHEPAARHTVDTLRYMTSNIYNNLLSAALQPLRLIGLDPSDDKPGQNPDTK